MSPVFCCSSHSLLLQERSLGEISFPVWSPASVLILLFYIYFLLKNSFKFFSCILFIFLFYDKSLCFFPFFVFFTIKSKCDPIPSLDGNWKKNHSESTHFNKGVIFCVQKKEKLNETEEGERRGRRKKPGSLSFLLLTQSNAGTFCSPTPFCSQHLLSAASFVGT